MTEDPSTLMNKIELLSRIKTSYADLLRLVGNLDDALLGKSLEEDGWAIKDNLAHIAAWEDVLIRFHIQAQPFDQVIGAGGFDYWASSEDELNEHFYRQYRDWSGQRVLAHLQATHERLIEVLDALPEDRLAKTTANSGEPAQEMNPLINYVIGNTYEHYQEHLDNIQEIIDRLKE